MKWRRNPPDYRMTRANCNSISHAALRAAGKVCRLPPCNCSIDVPIPLESEEQIVTELISESCELFK